MQTTPKEKVSVIIPLFNREEYIYQTVKSVLDQTYSDFVLYIVDDGCTDKSRETVERIKDDRIVILEHPRCVNKGQSASINLGLEQIAGEYVSILDSDDFWEIDKLAIQVDYLEKNPSVGVIYCNGVAADANNNFLYDIYKPGHVESNHVEQILLNCYLFLPTNSMVRASVFKAAGFFHEDLRAGQDHDMLIRLVEISGIAYVNKKVFTYRRHGGSISENGATLRWKNGFKILDRAVARYNYPKYIIRKRKAVLRYRLAKIYVNERKILFAVFNIILSGLYDPLRAIKVLFGREKETSTRK